MAALQGAVPVPQVDGVAEGIGEDLHLHVTGAGEIALEQHIVIPEGGQGFPFHRREGCVKLVYLLDPAHPLAAATAGGLDKEGEADLVRLITQQGWCLIRAVIARQHGDAGCLHQRLGAGFVPHGEDGGAAWADKAQPLLCTGAGKVAVLRQKTVAGVHGIGPGLAGNLQHLGGIEVALPRGGRPQVPGLVRFPHMHGAGVGVRVEGYGVNAEAAGGLDDAHGYLASIGDQQALDGSLICHVCSSLFIKAHSFMKRSWGARR
ncbi:hypothetical protein D3C75_773330 [compost metagenome]